MYTHKQFAAFFIFEHFIPKQTCEYKDQYKLCLLHSILDVFIIQTIYNGNGGNGGFFLTFSVLYLTLLLLPSLRIS
jgi:hypothetical protein